MKSREQIARAQFEKLDVRDRKLVLDWVELGNSWEDALLSSGVLTGPRPSIGRFTPSEAARQAESDRMDEVLLKRRLRNLLPDETSRRYETSHHEAAHSVVVMAFGKALRSVRINDDDARGGLCTFGRGCTSLEVATICIAPVVWIEQVFYKQFRHYLPSRRHFSLDQLFDTLGDHGRRGGWCRTPCAHRHRRPTHRDDHQPAATHGDATITRPVAWSRTDHAHCHVRALSRTDVDW